MKIMGYGILIVITVAFNVWAIGELSFDKELSVMRGDINNLSIDVGSGSLTVRGEDVEEINVFAKVYSTKYNDIDDLHEAFSEKVDFSLDNDGSVIRLKACDKKGILGRKDSKISIDVEVIVPRNMNLEIDDGSGTMHVSDLQGLLSIDDSSGSATIKNIGNNLTIDDGSGNLEIDSIKGDVHIDDGSGKLILTNIHGDLFVEDGSGELNVTNVTGNMTLEDGSGSVIVNELAGKFKLIDAGSGSVHVNGQKWHKH